MGTVLSILGAILLLGILIIIHELGHYGVARALGFKVDEFAVGFGPKIFRKEKNGITYSLRLLPLGGFCRFHGEDQDKGDDTEAFNSQKAWKRFLVVLAGAFMNILFAFILAAVTLLSWGDSAATIHSINENSPAQIAGLMEGDQIIKVDGQNVILDFNALDRIGAADSEEGVTLTVRRDGQDVDIDVRNLYDTELGKNMLGVTLDYTQRRSLSFGESVGGAGEFLVYSARTLVNFFGQLVGKLVRFENVQSDVLGPIGTVSVISQAVSYGWESVFRLAVFLSLNLGVFNLLPFPGLDGGRLIFILIEMIFRKPVPREKEGWIHLIGMGLLFLFIIYISIGDILLRL